MKKQDRTDARIQAILKLLERAIRIRFPEVSDVQVHYEPDGRVPVLVSAYRPKRCRGTSASASR